MSCVPPYAEAEFYATKQAGAPREDDVPSRDEAEAPERDVPSLPVFAASTWRLGRVVPFVLVAALSAGCGVQGPERRSEGNLPPTPTVAAPKHPWCPECDSLPNLGTGPRVSRRGP